jgi:hypothetical protein
LRFPTSRSRDICFFGAFPVGKLLASWRRRCLEPADKVVEIPADFGDAALDRDPN